MISKRLNNLFLITLIPIYLHGIEEILTGFSHIDSFMVIGSHFFNTSSEQFYWVSHIIFWLLLPVLYLFFYKTKVALFLFSLFGLFFIVELHHIYKAVLIKNYYPGLITSLAYPVIGFFYIKELIKIWRKNYGRN